MMIVKRFLIQAVSVNSLAGVIEQLGNLAKHADQIFTGLVDDAAECFRRAQNVSTRINTLQVQIAQLDYRNEGLPHHAIALKCC